MNSSMFISLKIPKPLSRLLAARQLSRRGREPAVHHAQGLGAQRGLPGAIHRLATVQYSLAVPFLERIVSLAVDGGFTGQITANSFMKREFGKKLIEEFFPRVDLTHVIDTSGAYIPGHGTPTVILFARNRRPVASTLRTVMGIRGEPSTPDDPARGLGVVGHRCSD